MKNGTQYILAKKCGLAPGFLSYLMTGKKHASYKTACRLAEITGSDPTLWLNGGGTPEERQAAFESWAVKQEVADVKICKGYQTIVDFLASGNAQSLAESLDKQLIICPAGVAGLPDGWPPVKTADKEPETP